MSCDKKYYCGLDLLKLVLAIIVVIRHACQSFLPPDSPFYVFNVNVLSPCAVPCFFIISGFLFFERQANIKKQIGRLLKLYIAWSIIYLPLFLLLHKNTGLLKSLQEFVFIGSYYHLWFLPSLIIALLINCLLRNANQMVLGIILLIMFLISALSEPYSFLIPEGLNGLFLDYKEIFLTFRNGLFFGSIYVFIGKQLVNIKFSENHTPIKIILLIFSFAILLLEGYSLNYFHHYAVVNILISCLFFSSSVFVVFASLENTVFKNEADTRNISTFTFCVHPIIISIISKVKEVVSTYNLEPGGGDIIVTPVKPCHFMDCY